MDGLDIPTVMQGLFLLLLVLGSAMCILGAYLLVDDALTKRGSNDG